MRLSILAVPFRRFAIEGPREFPGALTSTVQRRDRPHSALDVPHFARPLSVSRRSASVSSLPHSHPKRVLSEYHTESGPPSTVRSPHSSHARTTLLEEPFICQPPLQLWQPTNKLAHPRGEYNVNPLRVDASSGSLTLHKAQVQVYLNKTSPYPLERRAKSIRDLASC